MFNNTNLGQSFSVRSIVKRWENEMTGPSSIRSSKRINISCILIITWILEATNSSYLDCFQSDFTENLPFISAWSWGPQLSLLTKRKFRSLCLGSDQIPNNSGASDSIGSDDATLSEPRISLSDPCAASKQSKRLCASWNGRLGNLFPLQFQTVSFISAHHVDRNNQLRAQNGASLSPILAH